jgi:hypothetical protein
MHQLTDTDATVLDDPARRREVWAAQRVDHLFGFVVGVVLVVAVDLHHQPRVAGRQLP